jgi:hypothetical protein
LLYPPPPTYSPVAQLVEQLTVNQLVTGSSPVRGAIVFKRLAQITKCLIQIR